MQSEQIIFSSIFIYAHICMLVIDKRHPEFEGDQGGVYGFRGRKEKGDDMSLY